MLVLVGLVLVLSFAIYLFMQQPIFGTAPANARLERIRNYPTYKHYAFQNLVETPMSTPDGGYWKMLTGFFSKPAHTLPASALPSIKTDLKQLPADSPSLVWFGHSSYLLHIHGRNILVDPVFSGQASPVWFMGRSFPGTDAYQADDFPELDMVILTHDHYDHLDYKTILKLKDKTKHFYTSVGVGAHLEYWGIPAKKITELYWWESIEIDSSTSLTATPARHFSGRKFSRGKSLWASYILKINGLNLYLGGDSGYEKHFEEIGQKFGPFDLAILECGQYNLLWPYIHMMPEEVVEVCKDLKTTHLLPVHWAKFELAFHPWKEPIERLLKATEGRNINVITPMIGERVNLLAPDNHGRWWKDLK